jgi:hypothetical protein
MSEKIKEVVIKGKVIPKELVEIILKRIDATPSNIKLALLGKVLTKEDILNAVKDNTPLGQEILEMEVDYYEDLIRD